MEEIVIDNPDRNNDWKVNSADYLEIKSQFLRSSKEQRKWLIANINLTQEWLVKLKNAFIEFTWLDIPNFEIKDIIKILSFNNSFNFFELNKAIELFGSEISPEKVLQILEYQPNFNFTNIIDVKKVLWDEFKIDNVIQILEIKPNFDFEILISLKNTFWDDFNMEKIIKILKIQPNLDLTILTSLKNDFWNDLTINKVIIILKINNKFNFNLAIKAKKIFWNELTIDKIIEIVILNSWFDFDLFIKARLIFWTELTIDEVMEILKDDTEFDIDQLIEAKILFWDDLNLGKAMKLLSRYWLIETKKIFWNELTIDIAIKILEINEKLNFYELIEAKNAFWDDLSIGKVIQILEIKPDFYFLWLIDIKNAFNDDFSVNKMIDIIKNNPTINIFNILVFIEFNDGKKNNIINIDKIWNRKITIDEIMLIYNVYEYIDVVRINRLIEFINISAMRNKEEFSKIFLQKLFNENYVLPWKEHYLWNNEEFKACFLFWIETFLDGLIDLQILSIIRAWQSEYNNIFDDPAIDNLKVLLKQWLLLDKNMEIKMIIARNLYFSRLEVNEANVNAEYQEYIKNKDSYKGISLFKDRNIIFTAHNEWFEEEHQTEDKNKNFWKKATIEAIRKQWWDLPDENIIHPKNNNDDLKKAKNKSLEKLETTKIPMTFIFDWHGWPDAIYFSNWGYVGWKNQSVEENENTIKITFQEMVKALIERAKNKNIWGMTKKEQKDILILASCFNHTFIRNLYDELNKYNNDKNNSPKVNLPICIWQSEYWQLWYSNPNSNFWNDFFWKVIDFEWWDNDTTIWDVNDRQEKLIESNPSIYVPDKNNVQKIIGQTEIEQTNSWTV